MSSVHYFALIIIHSTGIVNISKTLTCEILACNFSLDTPLANVALTCHRFIMTLLSSISMECTMLHSASVNVKQLSLVPHKSFACVSSQLLHWNRRLPQHFDFSTTSISFPLNQKPPLLSTGKHLCALLIIQALTHQK
jgi:hypothetical protein